MKKAAAVLLCAGLLFASMVLRAPAGFASDTGELEARVEKLEKEIAELKALLAEKKAEKPAEKPAAAPGIEFSGKAYLSYEFDANGGAASDTYGVPDGGDSKFAIERWYFTGKKKLSDDVGLAFTTDVRTTSDGGRFDVFFKNAYLEFKNVVNNATLIVGQQGTPWTGNDEKAWKYRVLRKTFADEAGLLVTTDFGVGLKGEFSNKRGDYHLMFSNGEGFGSEEEGQGTAAATDNNANGKDLTGRVSFKLGRNAPRLSLYGDAGSAGKAPSNRLGAMLDRQLKYFSYGAGYLWGRDGKDATLAKKRGYSIYGNYDFPATPWAMFARYDNFDPSKTAEDDKRTAIITGFAYRMDKSVMLTLSGHFDEDESKNPPQYDPKDVTLKAAVEVSY